MLIQIAPMEPVASRREEAAKGEMFTFMNTKQL